MSNRVAPLPPKPENAQGTQKPTSWSQNGKAQNNDRKPVDVNGNAQNLLEHGAAGMVSSVNRVWEINRYRIHSIFSVCVLSALTIFSVLIYDIVVDGMKVRSVTSNGLCLQSAFRMVDTYFDLLSLYDVTVLQNNTACNASNVTVSETSPNVTDVFKMCDEYSVVFQPQCELVLSELLVEESMRNLTFRTEPFLEILFKLRDGLLDCFTTSGLLPWTYPSLFHTFLTLLWNSYQRAFVCCYLSSSSSPSSLPSFSSSSNFFRNSTIDQTVSYLMYIIPVSNLRTVYPELRNVTDLLLRSKLYSDCSASSSISEIYQIYQSVFSFVKLCVGALDSSAKEENSETLSYYTRRVVFNCCAVLVGIAMAVGVSFRVRDMADWIGRYVNNGVSSVCVVCACVCVCVGGGGGG